MLNCVTMIGRLVADPELRNTPSGTAVTSFTIAVDRDFVKAGEERQADFIDIVAWQQKAEFITRFFRKGSFIAIQGSLQTRTYEDKNGNKRKAYEIIADKVSFCGSKSDNAGGARPAESASSAPAPSYATGNASDFETIPNDDELPF